MPYQLNLCHDAATALVLSVLKDDVEMLKADRDRVLKRDRGLVFTHDREKDLVLIEGLIVGYNRVLNYYGEKTSC